MRRSCSAEQIHAKILLLRYFTEGDHMRDTGNLLSYCGLPWGEVYYRQFYDRRIMRLARMFGNRLDIFKSVMEGLKGIPILCTDSFFG